MTTINYNYKFSHRCFRYGGYSGLLILKTRMDKDMEKISGLIKACDDIEEIIGIVRMNSEILNLINIRKPPYFHFEITIDDRKVILSHKLKILEGEDLERERFEPYVKYDIDDIREGTIKPLECWLYQYRNDPEEQIAIIEKYISKPYRRFSKWTTKPGKLFLYHTYGEDPKEFKIDYDFNTKTLYGNMLNK